VSDYVSGRADALAALFGFSGLYFAIRGLGKSNRESWKFHALAALALLASALSKEVDWRSSEYTSRLSLFEKTGTRE
jgi:hypothetical protein